jgi:hypothetical protein
MYTGRGPEFNDDIVYYGVNVSFGGNGGFHIMQGLKYSIVHEFIVVSINCIVRLVLYWGKFDVPYNQIYRRRPLVRTQRA